MAGGQIGVEVGVAVGVDVGLFVGVGVSVGVGVELPDVIVKFASEMSKKMFPTASTLTRAVVVGMLGMNTDSVPSFAVLALITVGNVLPPSVDSDILTFAALTGALVVFATFQVIVCCEPPP